MSKFSLIINTDNPAEIAAVLAACGGAVAHQPVEDDDNGPTNTNAPTVDSAGLPWDERIHAKSKGIKADGTWKRGRGVTDQMASAVEAELRARNAGPVPQMQPQAQQAPFVPPATQFAPVAASPAQQFQPPVQQPAGAPAHTPDHSQGIPAQYTAPMPQQPAQTQQPQAIDFSGLMTGLNKSMTAGKLTINDFPGLTQEINAAWQSQLSQLTDLGHPQNSHIIPWVKEMLVNKGIWVA